MKTLFVLLVLVLSGLVYSQGAPAANEYGFPYDFELDRNISNGLLDTLQGSSDSVTLLNRVTFSDAYDYILRVGVTTGSGSDSVEGILRIDYFGNAGDTTFIYSTSFDTVSTATGEAILLPINRSGWSKKATVKLMAGARNGGVVIFNNFSVVKRLTKVK